MAQVFHDTAFPDTAACDADLETQKNLMREVYATQAPLLNYRILDLEASKEDELYHDTRTVDRDYDPPVVQIHTFGPLDPYEYNYGKWGVDEERNLTLFSVCVPELEDLVVTLKPGDVIEYDGQDHEIQTVKRLEDAYYAHTNYAFEFILATYIPNVGS